MVAALSAPRRTDRLSGAPASLYPIRNACSSTCSRYRRISSFVGRYAPEQAFEGIRIPVEGAVLDGLLFRQPASRAAGLLPPATPAT